MFKIWGFEDKKNILMDSYRALCNEPYYSLGRTLAMGVAYAGIVYISGVSRARSPILEVALFLIGGSASWAASRSSKGQWDDQLNAVQRDRVSGAWSLCPSRATILRIMLNPTDPSDPLVGEPISWMKLSSAVVQGHMVGALLGALVVGLGRLTSWRTWYWEGFFVGAALHASLYQFPYHRGYLDARILSIARLEVWCEKTLFTQMSDKISQIFARVEVELGGESELAHLHARRAQLEEQWGILREDVAKMRFDRNCQRLREVFSAISELKAEYSYAERVLRLRGQLDRYGVLLIEFPRLEAYGPTIAQLRERLESEYPLAGFGRRSLDPFLEEFRPVQEAFSQARSDRDFAIEALSGAVMQQPGVLPWYQQLDGSMHALTRLWLSKLVRTWEYSLFEERLKERLVAVFAAAATDRTWSMRLQACILVGMDQAGVAHVGPQFQQLWQQMRPRAVCAPLWRQGFSPLRMCG